MKQSDIDITSKVKVVNGTPRLFINNRITEGDSYITYNSENNLYKEFNDIGFNKYSINVFFSTRTINEGTQIPPFSKGIFDSEEGFKLVDKEVKKVLDINPNAYIFFRVDTSLPKLWDDKHPNELNDVGLNNNPPRPCIASEIYKKEVKKCLKLLVEHVVNSPYAKNVFGYQLSGYQTQEWFAFDYNGNEGKRMREKYLKLTHQTTIDQNDPKYFEFKNNETAKFICSLARFMKKITENRLVIGTFYGYVMAVVYREFSHLALEKILHCSAIDFICSPIAYYTGRAYDNDNPLMLPLASLSLHKKLYFTENDTRTDLSRPWKNHPNYSNGVWLGPNRELSIEMCKMHYASSICRGHTYWWFDMWGGWYKDNDFLSLFKNMKELSVEALKESQKSVAQIAVITSPKSMMQISNHLDLEKVSRDIFPILGCSGLTYDVYISSDFYKIKNKYKFFIVLENYKTDDLIDIESILDSENIYHIIYKTESKLTSNDLRELAKNAGINVVFKEDVIVYENETYLYIHGVKDFVIEKIVGINLIPLLSNWTFPLKVLKGHGYLFKK